MSMDKPNTNTKPRYAMVDCNIYASLATKQFYYAINQVDQINVGDIYKLQFGTKKALGIVRKIVNSIDSEVKNIRKLEDKIVLPSSLPSYYLDLADWIGKFYVASSKAVWSCLLPSGIKASSRIKSPKKSKTILKKLNKLSDDQSLALKQILSSNTTLLRGITGSGKTEIYLHAINHNLRKNKSSILLVPEIMLTTQLESKLHDHFDGVITIHSGLSVAKRKQLWLECLDRSKKESLIVIGARSALFTPLHNLGLIIVDEEHEPSYKQESAPRYDAITVAAEIAKLTKSKLVLGSATPSLRTNYLATIGRIESCELKSRHQSELPEVEIIDIGKEQNTMISKSLKKEIDNCLTNNQQVLLFLNRRGSARALICNSCAQAVKCQNCNISLNYHGDINKLVCHYCNNKLMPPARCSLCGSNDLRFVGDGTKKLETEVKSIWTKARIARIDKDNSKLIHLQQTYHDLSSGELDIIIGTQMISRGIDIEKLHLVGIIDADSAMQIPDFTSSERTFSQICQAAGRAGRRSTRGKVIIQTRNPKSQMMLTAAAQDYTTFYNTEVISRQKFVYPPYCYLVKLQYAHKNAGKAMAESSKLKSVLVKKKDLAILGPTEHFRRTLERKTVYQIILKGKNRRKLVDLVQQLPSGWIADIDPVSLI